jgi:dTDP-D-glucose 4,6-dehydratase
VHVAYNKNILITGGCGFIGSNFITYFLEKYEDYRIVNLDLLTYAGNLDNLDEIVTNPSYCQKWCLSKLNQAAIRISGITSIPSENCTPSIAFAR